MTRATMDFRKKFVVRPHAKLKIGNIDPAYKGAYKSHESAAAEIARHTASLARISHTNRRIGSPNQRKLLCSNDFTQIRGAPRCRQSVARNHSILEPWKVAVWKRHSMAGWSPPTEERRYWERPIERSE